MAEGYSAPSGPDKNGEEHSMGRPICDGPSRSVSCRIAGTTRAGDRGMGTPISTRLPRDYAPLAGDRGNGGRSLSSQARLSLAVRHAPAKQQA
jgi:hypothetical protein